VEAIFSPSWYRVKTLRPRLARHARTSRQVHRGETWYVIHDTSNGQFLRISAAAKQLLDWMDGTRTVDEIFQLAAAQLGDESPTQGEVIAVLGRLHGADLLASDVPPDAIELFERGARARHRGRMGRYSSPFSIQLSVTDPERFLSSTIPLFRPLLSGWGVALWLCVVLPVLPLAAVHWSELTEGVLDQAFSVTNIVGALVVFVVLKTLHELGHGYATRFNGGEVHDMGIMLLMFAPVPYVDATSSWGFPNKYQRIGVSLAGMIVELFLAALALYIWLLAEPGAVRALAHTTLIIGGVTTLLFNANPLLRYDGYYALSDWLEIPNLRTRASSYLRYLIERYAFGNVRQPEPTGDSRERVWLASYAIGSFVYRLLIMLVIVGWLLDQVLLVGLLLGAFAMFGWIVLPLYRAAQRLWTSPETRHFRVRATMVSLGFAAVVAILVGVLPAPMRKAVEGVVWLPPESLIRPEVEGFVEEVLTTPGTRAHRGSRLFRLSDPQSESNVRYLEARVDELEAARADRRARREIAGDQILEEELRYARNELEKALEKANALEITSQLAGVLVVPRAVDLPGRFVKRGDLLGYVIDLHAVRVRALVAQEDIDLVRERLDHVEVRLAESLSDVHEAVVRRVIPAASDRLPSGALGYLGGGEVAIDPTSQYADRAAQEMFEVELEIVGAVPTIRTGGRVFVRFDLGTEPLAIQGMRRLRQIFLRAFHV
jgi:putative peptide zinc metalloprotease protein